MVREQINPSEHSPAVIIIEQPLSPGACHSGDATCLKNPLRATPFHLTTKGYSLENATSILNVDAYL